MPMEQSSNNIGPPQIVRARNPENRTYDMQRRGLRQPAFVAGDTFHSPVKEITRLFPNADRRCASRELRPFLTALHKHVS